ncbi:NUDIX domain-containing protein [Halorarum halophilum]|uniref:NUDIX domain-containing protein n=1 Tax=Halorarum halophilum TaxID=2743090 RepID=A0A7D5GIS6_9EURY|nr:NUDIX domain-containing protein [Halobaculum halophilum]QLG26344.1 NUDIX domain-containing protein [Halobaculum halophilum]
MITVPGTHCPLCGAELGRAEVEGRDRRYCPDCDRIVWQNSRPVAGIAVVDADRVLLVERATEPDFGTWGIPGGNIEYDEPPDVGAARELEEETGVGVDPDDLELFRTDHVARGGRGLVAVRYVVARADTTGEPAARQEVSDARFAAPEWFAGTEAGVAPIDRNAVRDASGRFD